MNFSVSLSTLPEVVVGPGAGVVGGVGAGVGADTGDGVVAGGGGEVVVGNVGQSSSTFVFVRVIVLLESYCEPSGRRIVSPHLRL